MTLRFAGGCLILALQLVPIAPARFVNDRYFCWAPFDQQTRYSIRTFIGDEGLSIEQIRRRYRRPQEGHDNRSAENLFDIITRAEQKFEKYGRSRVFVEYSINARPKSVWRYPPQ